MIWPCFPRRTLLAPEVIQTSAMDCGPASLKCLLEGFGIPVSYGRLREACQTDVDGTSIDTLEEVALPLGLTAEQVMIPADHLLLPESQSLPALLVVRLPHGATHFVVVWRCLGQFVQVMDPSLGRRWVRSTQLLKDVYHHQMQVPADAWHQWARSDDFADPLTRRIEQLGIAPAEHVAEASCSGTWRDLAALDAGTRLTSSLVRAGALTRGSQARRTLTGLVRRQAESQQQSVIPDPFWSVLPSEPDEEGQHQVLLKGIVLVRILGRSVVPNPPQIAAEQVAGEQRTAEARVADEQSPDATAPFEGDEDDGAMVRETPPPALTPELTAALSEPASRPSYDLLKIVASGGLFSVFLCVLGLLAAAAGVVFEALLLRSLLDISYDLRLVEQRLGAAGYFLLFVLALLLVEWGVAGSLLRLARRLELQLRMKFLKKIPQLSDRYFQSRPKSDMAERSHSTHQVRNVPWLAGELLRTVVTLVVTAGAICWLDPASSLFALAGAAAAMLIPLLFRPRLQERDLRVRTHTGALSRFYLDALLGLTAVKAHHAQRAIRREHEGLLVEWARASYQLVGTVVNLQTWQLLTGYGLAAAILVLHAERTSDPATALLLAYWALQLPALGDEVALLVSQYPLYRNLTLRLLEPLGAPAEIPFTPATKSGLASQPDAQQQPPQPGVAIAMRAVSVRAAGQGILCDVTFTIAPGEHVAILGASGAGKSTLVGLLLGWHRAAAGELLVDSVPLSQAHLDELRKRTAWVDPSVQLFNRTLAANIMYGNAAADQDIAPLGEVLAQSNLYQVLARLDEGLQTPLGGDGGLLSGGEAQLVRYARALQRKSPRLVILDEPFRGLSRQQRAELVARARGWWHTSTLLCVTHDVADALDFDRVLLIEGGRLLEQGPPRELEDNPKSEFAQLLAAARESQQSVWGRRSWRRLRLVRGKLSAEGTS